MKKENITYKKYCFKLVLFCIVDIVLLLLLVFNKKGVKTLNPNVIITLILVSIIFIIISAILKLKDSKYSYHLYQITDTLYLVSLAVVFVQILFLTLFFPAQVSGPSMNNTLVNEQFVLCDSNTKNLKVGDVVVIYVNKDIAKGNGRLSEGEYLVKRIVAAHNDEVTLDFNNDELKVNGKFICTFSGTGEGVLTFTLHENEVFVVGDNYNNSYDSRSFGQIDECDVIGIVKYKCNSIFNWEKVE